MSDRIGFSKIAEKISIKFTVLALMLGSASAAIPPYAKDLGPEDQNKQITVTVWLKQHNKAALDALVAEMYDKTSLNYHHFLTLEQYKARFAPTAKEASVVRDFLQTHNLSVTAADQLNHYVKAQGRIGDVQTAFNTRINRAIIKGEVHRINVSEAKITGPAAALVSTVQGMDDLIVCHASCRS